MASWLTHLRIAEKIKEKIKGIDLDYLMAGSIAPDSGKIEITHFCKGLGEDKYIDLEDFFDKHLRPEDILIRSDKTRSFYWGYYFHLIGDSLWNDNYLKPVLKQPKDEENLAYLFKEEMYSLDFEYLNKNPENNILSRFKSMDIKLVFFNEFSPHQIYENIKKISNYYDNKNYKSITEYRFLDEGAVEKFIDLAVQNSIAAFYK